MIALADLFSNGAVLQRHKPIPVWGWTDAQCQVSATLNGVTVYGVSALDGYFMLRFPEMEAGGPYCLEILNQSTGESLQVSDVLIGEVWLCSGQSNMAYWLGIDRAPERYDENGHALPPTGVNRRQAKEFKERVGKQTTLRFFTVAMGASGARESTLTHENPYGQDAARWIYLDETEAEKCTAVGAWFGLKIWQALGIPVGLIHSSYGATIVEAWTSRAGLMSNPDTIPMLKQADTAALNEEIWKSDFLPQPPTKRDWSKLSVPDFPDEKKQGLLEGWGASDYPDSSWLDMKLPGSWTEEGIAKIGAVWLRRTITLPSHWLGHSLHLHIGGIDKHDISFFNGVEIGRTGKDFEDQFWCRPRNYSIDSSLVDSETATIAIRAFSFAYGSSLNGNANDLCLQLDDTGEILPLAGIWKLKQEFECPVRKRNDPGAGLIAGPGRGNPNTPAMLFETMIRPLLPYALRGVIWYQGCSNALSIRMPRGYAEKMAALVRDWRYQFEQPDLPFIQVQLASFRKAKKYDDQDVWPYLRDEQRRACGLVPGLHMVTAIDAGEEWDIHPQDKRTPGTRLAISALANVYRKNSTLPCGPVYSGFAIEGNAIRLFFDSADGLKLVGNPQDSFFIAGADRVFTPVDEAIVEDRSLLVRSIGIAIPQAVRYAWADNPTSSLFNAADLPAAAFRTDIWE